MATTSTTSTTRRAVLAGTGAIAAAVATSAAALTETESLDAELLRLRAEYDRTRDVWKAYWQTHDDAEAAYFKMRRAEPSREGGDMREASGFAAVDAEYNRLMRENMAFVDAMSHQPARTFAGLVAKAEVSAIEDNMEPRLMASLVADILAMKAQAA